MGVRPISGGHVLQRVRQSIYPKFEVSGAIVLEDSPYLPYPLTKPRRAAASSELRGRAA